MSAFAEKINNLFIKAHREFADHMNGQRWVDVKFVHELLDSIKITTMKMGAEHEDALEAREAAKRRLAGQKDMPSSAKDQADAQKARVQASLSKQRMGE